MISVLKNIIVLFIDCQATNPDPEAGHLLEIGWARSDCLGTDPYDEQGIETFFARIPDGTHIPARVKKVTGIGADDVTSGLSYRQIWTKLRATAGKVARLNKLRMCPTIIHYARYEKPFLDMLHDEIAPGSVFPFDIICTHQIARRLFPELPRRGIKALAGYFGYSSGEKRRCSDHIRATACIWKSVVHVLEKDHQVKTYSGLKKWLIRTPVRSISSRGYPMKDRYRRHLPDTPGVYRMCRSNNDILYIGKARSLKKRVNSYFTKRGYHSGHILDMLTQARRINVSETDSALEAALLESDEIKKHNPPYNIALRDRAREVLFCNSTFTEFTTVPSHRHHIGPLMSKEPLYRLALLKPFLTVAGSDVNQEVIKETLTLSESYGPGIDCVKDGINIFLDRNQEILRAEPADYVLHRLGQKLWLYRDNDMYFDETENQPDVQDNTSWSPESVARAIENVVTRSMHTIRKGRLCILLSEASIVWQEMKATSTDGRFLVFENGAIVQRGVQSKRKKPPVPPGYKKGFLKRQHSFDVTILDRMKVLITELRKIVDSNYWIRVRLRPNVILDNGRMQKIFTWI